jgi:hypothetical protein
MKMAMYRWQVTHASPQPYFASRFHCCDDNNNDDNNNNNKIAEAEQKKNCVDSQKKKKKQTIIFDGFRFVWNLKKKKLSSPFLISVSAFSSIFSPPEISYRVCCSTYLRICASVSGTEGPPFVRSNLTGSLNWPHVSFSFWFIICIKFGGYSAQQFAFHGDPERREWSKRWTKFACQGKSESRARETQDLISTNLSLTVYKCCCFFILLLFYLFCFCFTADEDFPFFLALYFLVCLLKGVPSVRPTTALSLSLYYSALSGCYLYLGGCSSSSSSVVQHSMLFTLFSARAKWGIKSQ